MTTPPDAPLVAQCESEPIHIPGAVQPFAILLSVELPTLRITNASLNCTEAFGIEAQALVHRSLAEYLADESLRSLHHYLLSDDLSEAAPLDVTLIHEGSEAARDWELTAHYRDGALVVELETAANEDCDTSLVQRPIRHAVQAIFGTTGLLDLCQQAARQIRAITGYDRVMIYRFTEDWHGDVIAEARADHVHSYLHHHFPASDIPAQARAIFLGNWLRMIPDVGYQPVPVHPGLNPTNGMPLDLGLSASRSVSPLHVEYLRNMGVAATLTLPLIDDGKLWGLIACHHQTPNKLGSECRLGAKMIAQLVSSQLALKASMEDQRYGAELKRIHGKLLARMEDEDNLVHGLIKHSPTMLDLAGAAGAAAAIYYNNDWTIIGTTPTIAQIEQLVDWLSTAHAKQDVFFTNRLGSVFPPARDYKETGSGLLAVSIPRSDRNYILWFRPEVVTTVTWAGEPEKRLQMDGGIVRLHPRLSFDSWKQVVDGVAIPWKKVEIEAVTDLRASILALDLRRAYRKESAARALAERISMEKQAMVHTVSHDIRNPLSVIKMTLQMLQLDQAGAQMTVHDLAVRGMRAADAIERLVNAVLDQAKLEHGALPLVYRKESAKALVIDAVDLALPLAEKNGIGIVAAFDAEDMQVSCQRTRVEQVLGNLISNSLKFTPAGGRITVSARRIDGEAVLSVADTGIGIPAHLLPRVFERGVQGNVGAGLGAGLGLAIVKSIVEEDGGRIWVESTAGAGTTFSFTVPASQGTPGLPRMS